MTVILIFGAAAGGVVLGLRHLKVFALLPVILLVAAGAIAIGVATSLNPRTIAFGLLMTVLSPQIGYLVSAIGVPEFLRVRATNRIAALLSATRTAIGQELRTVFELPQELPREMAALLAQMTEQ
jgi:hypothetical protein